MLGVCINYTHENYGGMLQAYSTVKTLEDLGIEYELIRYKKRNTPLRIIKSIPRLLNGVLLNDKYEGITKKIGLKIHPEVSKENDIRLAAFHKFSEKNFIKLSPVFYGYKELCDGAKRYKAVMTGSDQLWSPAGLPTNFYNLMFVPDEIKKISYASSFGVKNIPWYQKKRTSTFLKRIEFISMRENRGSEIVMELTDRQVPTILDPVFYFDQIGWSKIVPEKTIINEPYVFAYFLGKNQTYRSVVKDFAQKAGLKIVTLRHMDQYIPADENFGDYAPYDIGPDDFLNLLRNAECVCTDSFHGMCFSIIHRKQFVIFNRYSDNSKHSKNSRIDSLCANLNIENRRYKEGDNVANLFFDSINYKDVEIKLNNLKELSRNYLSQAFSIKEKVE